jgi:hypothetical protein
MHWMSEDECLVYSEARGVTHLRYEAEHVDGQIVSSKARHEVDDEAVNRRKDNISR